MSCTLRIYVPSCRYTAIICLKTILSVGPWLLRGLRIQHCHRRGSGYSCGVGSIPGPGMFTCHGHDPPPKKIILSPHLGKIAHSPPGKPGSPGRSEPVKQHGESQLPAQRLAAHSPPLHPTLDTLTGPPSASHRPCNWPPFDHSRP